MDTIRARASELIGLLSTGAPLLADAATPQSAQANIYGYGLDDRQRIREINISNLASPSDLELLTQERLFAFHSRQLIPPHAEPAWALTR
jgi:hypothetical protein